jgi:hypothetical protein
VITHLMLTLEGREQRVAIDALFEGLPRRRWRGTAVTVWLSGALARPFLFGPIAGLKGWREAHEAATIMAPSACGLQGPCQVALEADPSRGAVLCTAAERSLLDALREAAKQRALRLAHVRPAWALLGDSDSAAADRMLCVRDVDALTVLAKIDGGWVMAATYSPAPAAAGPLLRRLQASTALTGERVALTEVLPPQSGQVPSLRLAEVVAEPVA